MHKEISLNQRLRQIGFRITYQDQNVPIGKHEKFLCDIEKTLIDATYEALNDGRLRSLIFSWFKVHSERIIVEKFFKLAAFKENEKGANPIINGIAVFCTLLGDHRYKKYIQKNESNTYLVGIEETESFGKVQGFKEDWLRYGVKVPSKLLRIRESDILTVNELSKLNLQYRNRLLIGTSWRADIITAMEWGAKSPSEIKNYLGCSYEPAHRIFHEFEIFKLSLTA